MKPESDASLIERYLKGDEPALRELYARHVPSVYNFISHLANNANEAEDIAQEAFIKAWKNLKKFDRSRPFRTWIYTIAKNLLFDSLKKKKPYLFSDLAKDEDDAKGMDIADERPLPDKILEDEALQAELRELLISLPPDQSAVIVMHAMQGMTFQEIGDILGQPMDTVKTRYRRAMARLSRLFQE